MIAYANFSNGSNLMIFLAVPLCLVLAYNSLARGLTTVTIRAESRQFRISNGPLPELGTPLLLHCRPETFRVMEIEERYINGTHRGPGYRYWSLVVVKKDGTKEVLDTPEFAEEAAKWVSNQVNGILLETPES